VCDGDLTVKKVAGNLEERHAHESHTQPDEFGPSVSSVEELQTMKERTVHSLTEGSCTCNTQSRIDANAPPAGAQSARPHAPVPTSCAIDGGRGQLLDLQRLRVDHGHCRSPSKFIEAFISIAIAAPLSPFSGPRLHLNGGEALHTDAGFLGAMVTGRL
jgi:hypothetical protein